MHGADLEEHTKALGELNPGDVVQIQNQTGPHANKWDMSGVVIESLGFDSYTVKVDGSGRVSKHNRRFLRPIRSYKDSLSPPVASERLREPMDAPPHLEAVPDSHPFSNILPVVLDDVRDDVLVPAEVPALCRSTREVRRPLKYSE